MKEGLGGYPGFERANSDFLDQLTEIDEGLDASNDGMIENQALGLFEKCEEFIKIAPGGPVEAASCFMNAIQGDISQGNRTDAEIRIFNKVYDMLGNKYQKTGDNDEN